ncbi:glycosyltransferase family 4 protein [Nitratifractor salsuginis]|uniref:Glycosyl transferase group 1 n=1 Tax=Nitratifractor salsuginis (strain DSM 16511 / JCM 12458 / E9I37-1) TaxID=749222 RepID=E6WZD3_NITSE|nr:glycosyltransferase family 4 protein [Nitratifractor salsuginis]ADV46645.1 glycosyl transferase group 1 [Nitratifractor salsuginis DSM 16511]
MKLSLVRRQFSRFGGGELFLQTLYEGLRKRGADVEIVQFSQPSWLPSWVKMLLYNAQACKKKEDRFYYSLDRLSCLELYNAGGGVHREFLKHKGFTLNPLHPVYLRLEKKTFENSTRIIAVSQMVKNDILRHYKIPPEKISVIYNGIPFQTIDDRAIENMRREVLDEYGIDADLPIVLFVGSGFKRKGVREFLQALSKLQRPFHAFVVGKESKLSYYRLLSRELGIEEHISFTGPRQDVERFYAASDIFFFPTRYEPFGNVVLEAMNYKNAVITTRQCGAGELIDSRYLLDKSDDPHAVELLRELIDNPQIRQKVQKDNYQIASRYTIEHNIDETLRLIKKITEEKR